MYILAKPINNTSNENELIEEFKIFATIGNRSHLSSEKYLGKLSVHQEEYSTSVEVQRTRSDGSTVDYKFDASRKRHKLKETDLKSILIEISKETNGKIQVFGSNYNYTKLTAKSHNREIIVLKNRKPQTEFVDSESNS